MKKIIIVGWMALIACMLRPAPATAQVTELTQLALNIEKLNQFRQILQQMYDAYKIIEGGYNKVKDITSGNYKLHQVFLDGLYQVSPAVRKYHRVPDIISYQVTIIKEYKEAFQSFKNSKVFSDGQLNHFSKVYQRLFDDSLKNLEELTLILGAGQLRMSDDERLAAIDRLYEDMKKKLVFLRGFNDENTVLAGQLLRERAELQTVKGLHDIR